MRNPAAKKRGVVSEAHRELGRYRADDSDSPASSRRADQKLHGRSFLPILEQEKPDGWDEIYASHTFHEVTMYYPMRVVRSGKYKLIWNIAHPLPFPFASDLWGSATWQDSLKRGDDFMYGKRTIKDLVQRPQFELYDLEADPDEIHNLAERLAARRDAGKVADQKLRSFRSERAIRGF